MSNSQIEIPLTEKTDRNGDTYYVGGLDLDVSVNLGRVSLFIFHGEEEDPDGPRGEGPKLLIRKKRPFRPQDNREG